MYFEGYVFSAYQCIFQGYLCIFRFNANWAPCPNPSRDPHFLGPNLLGPWKIGPLENWAPSKSAPANWVPGKLAHSCHVGGTLGPGAKFAQNHIFRDIVLFIYFEVPVYFWGHCVFSGVSKNFQGCLFIARSAYFERYPYIFRGM